MTTRVLIADDHAYFRTVITQLLFRIGEIEIVAEAADGQTAVSMAETHRRELDLVLMDINMPELDGASACEQIKAVTPNLPVILYTASDLAEFVHRTQAVADALLGKQDLFTDLPPLLKKYTNQHQS